MIRFTFEAKFPDGSPRRFAGTHRPTFDSIRLNSRTPDGTPVLYFQSHAEVWREGRFDVPLYHLEEDENDATR